MPFEKLCQPCRNFCFMAGCLVTTPTDGRRKFILSSFVSGATGALVFIDCESGISEMLPLPGDEGAEGLLNLDNELLLAGTAAIKGYLHALDLRTMQWREPLRIESETYIWNMARGSDGLIYCGTYNGCLLLRYDPKAHTLISLGRALEDPKNQYTRTIFGGTPGKIIVNAGLDTREAVVWDIAKEEFQHLFPAPSWVIEYANGYAKLQIGEEIVLYDAKTLARIGPAPAEEIDPRLDKYLVVYATDEDGTKYGVRGQMYFRLRPDEKAPELKRIEVEPPPTAVMTLAAAADGRIWGSTVFGQTIFSYDPATGAYWNSLNVCSGNGEVYGIREIGGRIFLSAYAEGQHAVYDPAQPWDQLNNVNPNTFHLVGPKLIRPNARSVVGPDGNFWTGWMATYSEYGGGMTRANPKTLETKVWHDPIPGQALLGLAAGDKYIYFSSYGGANGLVQQSGVFPLVAWDTAGSEVARRTYPEGVSIRWLVWAEGLLAAFVKGTIEILDGETLEPRMTVDNPGGASIVGNYRGALIYLFGSETFRLIDLNTGLTVYSEPVPGRTTTAAVAPDGSVWFTQETHLFQLKPDLR